MQIYKQWDNTEQFSIKILIEFQGNVIVAIVCGFSATLTCHKAGEGINFYNVYST